ncbi:MAG: gamma-glutamyl-gamma-aminobutyrate hydrolase family protein [Bacteroidales bacterium]|nr:gamma-glutamyl-gamma-aminobutyrate hydrolase family protein [Bacteroidales bacterium]
MSLKINVLFFVLFLFASCVQNVQNKIIVISADTHENHVTKWLSNFDDNVQIVTLYGMSDDSVNYYLSVASGVVITGGEDVNPALYGKDSLLTLCGTINNYRDSLEIKMINFALLNKIPLFGICRGLQIMNVSQGGSLIVDIPYFVGDTLHRILSGRTYHNVNVLNNSLISEFIDADSGLVLSNHHQAIDQLAEIFNIAAFASDSVIEAIEIKDTNKYNFAAGVQWHPEGMNFDDAMGKPFAIAFLKQVDEFYKK